VKARDAVGWLVDYAGSLEDAVKTVWKVAGKKDHGLAARTVERGALDGVPKDISGLPDADSPTMEAARRAIMRCVDDACHVDLTEAITVQARRSAEFMVSADCRGGRVGSEYSKTMLV
jgi:hypothetical protein